MKQFILTTVANLFLVAIGQPIKTIFKQVGDKTVYEVSTKNVYVVTSELMTDADGSPKAYNQDNSKGLDYLVNVRKVGN